MGRFLSFLIFISIVLAVYGSAHYYVYKRFLSAFPEITQTALAILRIVLVVLVITFPLASILGRVSHNFVIKSLYWVSAIWIGLFFYIFLLTALMHGLGTILKLAGFLPNLESALGFNPARMGAFIVAILSISISIAGISSAYKKPDTTIVEIPIKNLPDHLNNFRIVQLSDIHLGIIVDESRLEKMIDIANSLNPDIVVITGDLMDAEALNAKCVTNPLKKLKTKYGAFAITGNHEFYAGVDEIVKRVQEAGVKFLRNESVKVTDGLIIYGIDDPDRRSVGLKPVKFEDVIDPEAKANVAILLYHRPEKLEEAQALGIDLILSGHTHKGQLWPFTLIAKLAFSHQAGHFIYKDTHQYVTRGAGTWGPPMRVLAPPEIPVIVLKKG